MPRHVIQSFSYVSMYIVGGNHRSRIASRFSMYHIYIVGGNHRSHIASRFSIYRNNKILLYIVFVNKENGVLRDLLKILW